MYGLYQTRGAVMGRNYFKLEDVSQEYLNQVFDYQEGKLIWKSPLAKWVKVGSEAGYKRVDGYCVVNIGGSPKLVHRIIWKMIYGQSPSLIDHIDQNPTNNKVENLRPYSKRLNAYNISKLFSHNTSGIRGISRSANLNWIV